MSEYRYIRRQQILREAEGYLDLVIACADELPLSTSVRDRMAQRALDTLGRLDAREIRKDKERLLYITGQALRVMERHEEAIESFEHAAELDPENLHIWLALGWCHKRTGRLDLAIESLEEALSVEPGEAIVYYNLACYWSLVNNPKLALPYLTRALEIDPSYRDLVAHEHDFDPIRNHPGFLELTSVVV